MKNNTVRVDFSYLNSANALRTIVGKGPYHLASIGQDGSISYKKTRDPRKWADKQQRQKRSVYYHHNIVKPGVNRKPRKSDFSAARYAHTEIDPQKGESAKEAIARVRTRVRELRRQKIIPWPTIMVSSGGGVHLYWRFKQPITDIEAVEAVNRRLAELLDGDAAHDVSRLLRVPETMNYPNAKKRAAGRTEAMARLVYCYDEIILSSIKDGNHVLQRARKYTLDDFERAATSERVVASVDKAAAEDINPELLLKRFKSKTADEWRAFIKRTDKSKGAKKLIEKYTHGGKFDRSDAMAGAATYMRGQGLTREEVAAVLLNEAWRIGDHARGEGRGMWRAIERVADGKQAQERVEPFPSISMGDVVRKPIDWLWYPYLARGEVTILEGDGGAGKSYLIQMVGAAIVEGKPLKSERAAGRMKGKVLYFDPENDAETIIKGRLEDNGCENDDDFEVVHAPFTIENDADFDRMMASVEQHRPQMVVFDTMNYYIGKSDINRQNEAARVAEKFTRVARTYNCSVVILRHLTKDTRHTALYRGGGSVAFTGSVRIQLVVGLSPDDETVNLLASSKHNMTKPPLSLEYWIEELPAKGEFKDRSQLHWGKLVDVTADEAVHARDVATRLSDEGRGPSKLGEAKKYLNELDCYDESVSLDYIKQEATKKGYDIKDRTLRRAMEEVGFVEYQGSSRKKSYLWIRPTRE